MTTSARPDLDLKDVSTHFRFGENWADYAQLVDEDRVTVAMESLATLVGDLAGKTFLDIGSGSGLMSVAATRLGARKVVAIDIDEDSVATTRKLLSKEGRDNWTAETGSVFDLPTKLTERFDVVYSWGVLHHTGAMWRAIEAASAMAKPGGILAIALYEKTPFCGPWTYEKRIYRRLPRVGQKLVLGAFLAVWGTAMVATGHNPWKNLRSRRERGMNPMHDMYDWLGGYPYESTSPAEVTPFLTQRGFELLRINPWRIRAKGIFGTGCTEYVLKRT